MKRPRAVMYSIVYRLRKKQVKIDTRSRTIFYEADNEAEEVLMNSKLVLRLCSEWGFGRQSEFR